MTFSILQKYKDAIIILRYIIEDVAAVVTFYNTFFLIVTFCSDKITFCFFRDLYFFLSIQHGI